jgi:hypothetical protein
MLLMHVRTNQVKLLNARSADGATADHPLIQVNMSGLMQLTDNAKLMVL